MKKVALVICAHCRPEILKLTIGTWLEQYKGEYEAKIFVSLHKNYSHYCDKLSEITSIPNVEFVFVDEIQWNGQDMLRYSRMHAVAIMAILNKVKEESFTHVAILDHDLIFKEDFVGWCLKEYPESDMVCSLMGDRTEKMDLPTCQGHLTFAPKVTAWHIMFSWKMIERFLADKKLVIPGREGLIVYDTMARAYKMASSDENIRLEVVSNEKLAVLVEHLKTLSFNFGFLQAYRKVSIKTPNMNELQKAKLSGKNYRKRAEDVASDYNRRFPDGIDGLLAKLS